MVSVFAWWQQRVQWTDLERRSYGYFGYDSVKGEFGRMT